MLNRKISKLSKLGQSGKKTNFSNVVEFLIETKPSFSFPTNYRLDYIKTVNHFTLLNCKVILLRIFKNYGRQFKIS